MEDLQIKNNDYALVEAGMHAQPFFAANPEAESVDFTIRFAPVEGRPELTGASDDVTVYRDGRMETR